MNHYKSKLNKIKLGMLKKYENFVKISKGSECSFYEANLRADMNKVLIKRIKQACSWDQMLRCKALKIQSNQPFFPKMSEIFKFNGSYFATYERPSGYSFGFTQQSIKLQVSDFYELLHEIISILNTLKKEIPQFYVYPEWMFLHRSGVKICHFQPYFIQKDNKKQQTHVFMYDVTTKNRQQQDQTQNSKRIRNTNFNLGYIAYHLLTGITTKWKQDMKDYEQVIKEIQLNAEVRVMKQTEDQKIASLVSKLLNCTDNFRNVQEQKVVFQKMRNYVGRRNHQFRCCKSKDNLRIVEVSLETMKLSSKIQKIKAEKKKKCFRPCCPSFQDEPNPEENPDDRKFRVVQKSTHKQKTERYRNNETQIRRKRIVTQTSPTNLKNKNQGKSDASNKPLKNRHKRINLSCVFLLLSQRRSSLMLQKIRIDKARSTMFKSSNFVAQTPKKFLKTEL